MFSSLSIPGYAIARHYDSVTSTMDVARELLSTAPMSANWRALVTASKQTAGRGRQGRSWISTQGAFMGTFLFGTKKPTSELSGYSLAVGVCLVEALEVLGIEVRLKWPNDVVAVDSGLMQKLGGILIEVQEVDDCRCILVGVGLNNASLPEALGVQASSLRELRHESVADGELAYLLAEALLRGHEEFVTRGGFSLFVERWRQRSCFVSGRTEITIDGGSGIETGKYLDVTDYGALVLEVEGSQRVYHSAHIHAVSL